jgi:glycosyltransferase involved in cell wall biosynthesis
MATVLIDIYKTHDIYSGLGQFSYNYARNIAEMAPFRYDIHFLGKHRHAFIKNSRHSFEPVSYRKRFLPAWNRNYDLWHSLHQFPSHLPDKRSKYILTIHDLNFLIEKNESKIGKYLIRLQRNIDRADAITVISHHTQKVVEQNLDLRNKPIYTIHNGVELKPYPNPVRPDYAGDGEFFFTLGVIGPKKNFRTLVPLMHHFKDYKLIIAGNKNSDSARQIEAQIIDNNLQDRVILPGKITDKEKYWLYRNCRAFLFPSIAEGFGLPVIEAMLAGKPVFLSRKTSLPEIGGDVAFYLENFDPRYMIKFIDEKLRYFDSNKEVLEEKILQHARLFTWENCINSFLKVYEEVLK